jgi:ABC-type nickel/cobalt efflux system permease component RcnA
LGVLSVESIGKGNHTMIPANAAPLAIALLGLVLGMRHATDPDHVIAVTTILSREHRLGAATRVGVVWGLGHTLTVLLVGAAIIVFKIAIPTRLGLAMEFAVAIVLILLGVNAAAGLVRGAATRMRGDSSRDDGLVVHSHPHAHHDATHSHPHVHADLHGHDHEDSDDATHHDHRIDADRLPSFAARRPMLRSFAVGLVHGLAGSAAIALLVLSAIPSPLWATLYLAIFCVGTIIGMGLITTAIATPFMVASRRASWIHQGLVTGSGLLSFGFGLFLAYRIGIVDHLFSVAPIWIPQ